MRDWSLVRVQSTDKVFLRKARTREETEFLHAGAGGDLGGTVDLR